MSRFVVMLALCAAVQAQQAERRPYTSWPDYGGSPDSMQYSALTQIDRTNVSRLERAWFFPVPDRKGNFGFNPIVVDRVMYALGPSNAIVALDAASGALIWSHPVDGNGPGNRGMNYEHDVHDWLGGYPYESIRPSEVAAELAKLGFEHVRSKVQPYSTGLFGSGCDEFVYRRAGA